MDKWTELQSEGYVLLDGTRTKHWKLRCPKGHEFETTKHQTITRGVRCGKCSGRDPYVNFAKIKESIESEGWIILHAIPPEYRRFGYKMLLQNPEGKQMWMTGDSWERGHRTVRGEVKQTRNRSIESVKEEFKQEGYVCQEDEYQGAKHKMKALCPEGHELQIHYNHWQQGVRCSICKGSYKKSIEEINRMPQVIAASYRALGREKTSWGREGVRFSCGQGHEYVATLSAFNGRGDRCPFCNPKSSQAELELLALLQAHYPQASKSQHLGFELDIFVPEKNFAVEYCGIYWHSSKYKAPDFHFLKYQKCKEADIKLYTVFEDEWLSSREKVLARLLPPAQVLYARDTEFVEVTKQEARAFEAANHLQGPAPRYSTLHVGLRHQGSLVSTMSFGPHHRNQSLFVLQRLTFGNSRVVGGVEKMLKNAKLPNSPVVTWSDNRWSWGEVYAKVGFEKKEDLKPDYSYCVAGSHPQRYSKQSMRKTKEEQTSGKTELELRTEQGLLRIYDCGKIRWEYTKHLIYEGSVLRAEPS